tara:strand:- start:25 stop:138 length:114 start_codon:yes stop_codon:yes gene_type:complete
MTGLKISSNIKRNNLNSDVKIQPIKEVKKCIVRIKAT